MFDKETFRKDDIKITFTTKIDGSFTSSIIIDIYLRYSVFGNLFGIWTLVETDVRKGTSQSNKEFRDIAKEYFEQYKNDYRITGD